KHQHTPRCDTPSRVWLSSLRRSFAPPERRENPGGSLKGRPYKAGCYATLKTLSSFMRLRYAASLASVILLCAFRVLRAQKPFREYPGIEYENFKLPSDYTNKTEWTRARLMYPDITHGYYGRNIYWTMDYPRSDRH